MSQLMPVMFPCYLFLFGWSSVMAVGGGVRIILLHGKTRGEEIFQSPYDALLEMKVPVHKLVSVTTEGTSAMNSENFPLIGLCKKRILLFQT
jgi:hypothetical protein